ncbi:MAG: UDP-N-acetylmuramoyl-tripeptide--D-alanyl-D-alanine ligase [Pseudomonadales bacterium]|nr:UDP-N-acetylmuramoyl-tripeptide--D-alanyl-D-alanine ligase [Pseudomonadales bacterium]
MLISLLAEKMAARFKGVDGPLADVSADTRSLKPGDFFVVLEGPNFNAHEFLAAAVEGGIQGALISDAYYEENQSQVSAWSEQLAFIIVPDTRLGLGALGREWARQFDIPKVAITGSCGKTTVKEMVAAILREKGEVLATDGNKNNDIGVPLTLLRLRKHHRYAVIEMGANHLGEIAYTVQLVSPNAVVITNAAGVHLEGFGSLKGVAKAKAEILSGVKAEGCVVLNGDDEFFPYWQDKVADTKQLNFRMKQSADALATDLHLSKGEVLNDGSSVLTLNYREQSVEIKMHLLGKHNWVNAMAASALALSVGVGWEEIKLGLESLYPLPGRMEPIKIPEGYLLINDSYNANPFAMKAAIDVLVLFKGQKILVVGDMGELGSQSQRLHEDVGAYAKEHDVDRLLAVGQFASHTAAGFGVFSKVFASVEQIAEEIRKIEGSDFTVLVKGSRSARMERVIDTLLDKDAA